MKRRAKSGLDWLLVLMVLALLAVPILAAVGLAAFLSELAMMFGS